MDDAGHDGSTHRRLRRFTLRGASQPLEFADHGPHRRQHRDPRCQRAPALRPARARSVAGSPCRGLRRTACRSASSRAASRTRPIASHAPSGDLVLRRKPPGKILPGAHAVEREYRGHRGARRARLPGPARPRPVRGRQRHRHALLRHGHGRRPDRLGSAFPRAVARGARRALRRDERDHRLAPQLRPAGDRARRLRPPGGLRRAPGGALVEAISGRRRRRAPAGDGQAGRLARQASSARQRRRAHRPRRFSLRQHDLRRGRAQGPRGARLGIVDARRSGVGLHLPSADVPHARGDLLRARRGRSRRARHPVRGRLCRRLLPPHRPRRTFPTSTI